MKKQSFFSCIILAMVLSAATPAHAGDTPLGYPWSTWGEISNTTGSDLENGLKFDGYLEQGVDLTRAGSWVLNTFGGLRFTKSDESADWWNNKWGPSVGIKLRRNLDLGEKHWGVTSVGFRVEQYHYNNRAPVDEDTRYVLFLQWSAGGNWKGRD